MFVTIQPQLCEDAREVNALTLASAERLIVARAEFSHIEVRHHFVDNGFVYWPRPTTEVRVATHHHHLTDGQRKRNFDRLREHGAMFCEIHFARITYVGAFVCDRAVLRTEEPREDLDQCRLPCPVRSNDEVELPGRERDRDVLD